LAQAEQADCPGEALYLPAEHALHEVLLQVSEKVPRGHLKHITLPEVGECLPGSQLVQEDDCDDDVDLPAGHATQLCEPVDAAVPATQAAGGEIR
jgi:hypothetical protein